MTFSSIYFLFSMLPLSIHWVVIPWLGLAFEAASFIPSYCQNVSAAWLVPTVASSVGAAPSQLGSLSCPLWPHKGSKTLLPSSRSPGCEAGTLQEGCLMLPVVRNTRDVPELGDQEEANGESSTGSRRWLVGGWVPLAAEYSEALLAYKQ